MLGFPPVLSFPSGLPSLGHRCAAAKRREERRKEGGNRCTTSPTPHSITEKCGWKGYKGPDPIDLRRLLEGLIFETLQPADIGLPTGNGKKLSCSQAQLSAGCTYDHLCYGTFGLLKLIDEGEEYRVHHHLADWVGLTLIWMFHPSCM